MNYLYWKCNKCNFKYNLHMNLRCIECVKKQKERIRKVAIICRDRRRKQQINAFSQRFINNIITNITNKVMIKERDKNLYLPIKYKKVRFDLISDSDIDSESESKSISESESNDSDYIMFTMSESDSESDSNFFASSPDKFSDNEADCECESDSNESDYVICNKSDSDDSSSTF